MKTIIRDVIPNDKDAIFEVNIDSLSGVSAFDDEYFATLMRECALFRGVVVGQAIEGYVCALSHQATYDGEEFAWFRDHLADGFLYIDQIAIRRRSRGQGLGRALYQDMETYARENGLSALACEVNYEPFNAASQAFHRQFGFAEVVRMPIRGLVVSLLTKPLMLRT